MNDTSTGLVVVSTVPTVGYLLISGLVQLGIILLCIVATYFLAKRAGFDLLRYMRGEKQEAKKASKDKDDKKDEDKK